MKRRVLKAMWYQGIGRHSPDEIRTIGEADLQSCAEFLEEKLFFMGDQPTLVDATMFGFLAELAWHMPPDHWSTKCVTEKHKNLVNYCYRMKARYWPDWDDLLISKNK